MLDPSIQGLVVRFAHDDVHVAGVVVDQRLPYWPTITGNDFSVAAPRPE